MWCRHLDARDCTLYCAARCCYRWQPPSREKTKLISVFAAHQPGNDEHRTERKKKEKKKEMVDVWDGYAFIFLLQTYLREHNVLYKTWQ